MAPSLLKALTLLRHRSFVRAVLDHRVAAATEHLAPIRLCAANTLIDAGANKGQFSLAFRSIRPQATIEAFEPLPAAADVFDGLFAGDDRARCQRVALAATEGRATFHVADREDSSSLLRPGTAQRRAFGVSAARTIEVPIRRLDDCLDVAALNRPVMLKVDVQGGELGVFEGCGILESIDFVYVELSFVELYEGQPLFEDVHDYLARRGFAVVGVFNQVTTDEYGPTQVDVLFRSAR